MTHTSAPQSDATLAVRLFGQGRSRVVLCFGLLVAMWVRLPGFTSKDLWFDDAWAALPARASLPHALHMVVTTPGYTLINRWWIQLNPDHTWWAQLPTFFFGLLGVVAMAALLRYLGTSPLVQILGTAVVVLSPTTVTYSTRVKEYAVDFLFGIVLLVVAERIRRAPSRVSVVQLSVLSVVSIFVSFSTAVVVAGVWLAVLLLAVWQPAIRKMVLGWLMATIVATGLLVLPFASRVPSVLNRNWRRRGFLFDPSSLHSARHTAVTIFSGLAHGLFGVPIQPSPSALAWKVWSVVVALVVVTAIGTCFVLAARRTMTSRPSLSRTTPAALALLIAVVAAFASRVPLGDGRTDEALFPSLIVLVALLLGPRINRAAEALKLKSRAATALVVVVAVTSAMAFGALHLARYPTVDLRGLQQKLVSSTSQELHIVTVVDGFNAFGWGYYDLSPTTIAFGRDHGHLWPQGFHVVSTSPSVVISNNDMRVPGRFHDLAQRASALWYVGFEQGTYNPYSPYPSALHPSATYVELLREGWKPRPGYALLAEHRYAMLLTR